MVAVCNDLSVSGSGGSKENGPPRSHAKAHLEAHLKSTRIAALLNAERAAAAASALDVRVIELETRAFQCLDVIDGHALEVHFAHLINQHLEAIELVDIIGGIFLVLKSHMVAEAGAASTHDGDTQCGGRGVLLAHDFLNFRVRHWSNCNHFSIFTPCRFRRYLLHTHCTTTRDLSIPLYRTCSGS